ncbi:TonB-linked outer membrane protein, SusC/RagA family [Hydrobacter penzbergensis]|jgi:TonB-linked SusC/RagA family outer membrane protein|uniref:TonB-linked outer membrane protein, SusC/RagA family n=1 Tax=Hydrobacter penzbergensis TaxID=1235997 RepID=A0A8X8LAI2_9BACT|nr:TonB-dependent receptor [Hydrobacter penzbergensis]MBN8721183.1 TonB-dependent receptor [Sediminibacterium magnilacihabitans]PQV56828.1 TonB-linked SusC/RagA family outer membrane protein [Sediminibacterium magnilacihabitans]SDW40370.1 TonB-linked outer membrane protein, SusC/RagA family [Hydrobacter penzbergensis]
MRTRFCIARMLVVLTLLWGLASTAMAQNRQIAGTVTDAKGRALQGVSVSVAGTNTFTTTDANGKFTLSLKKPDDQVSFAYVGYVTKKVAPGTQSQLSVVLAEDESTTSEVVVTGYTAQRKKDITGAVTVVNAKQLTSVPAASVTQMLQGRAAGVNVGNDNSPGGGTMVRIRGFGTVNNNSPLYIIDGVPTQGTLNQINPNDIESMQVLKDASSASIYGARAANGVVIITTKKGKPGESNINFDYYTGSQRPDKMLNLLNTQELGQYLYLADLGAGKNPSVTSPSAQYRFGPNGEETIADYIYPNVFGTLPSNYTYTNDIANPQLGKTAFNITKANKDGTDWQNVIFGPATISNYQLGATGGGKSGRYAISGNYFDQKGILKYTKYKRYSVRANTEFTKGIMTFGENLTVAYDERQGIDNNNESNPIMFAIRVHPIIPVFDITGGPPELGGTNTSPYNGFAGSRGSNLGNAPNPFARLYREKDNITKGIHIFGNVFAELQLTKNLKARSSLGVEINQYNRNEYFHRDIEAAEPRNTNSLNVINSVDRSLTWFNTLNYNKAFGDHLLNVLVGTEAVKTYAATTVASRSGFAFDDLDYRYLDAGSASGLSNSGAGATRSALFSQFGKVNYSYKNTYLADFTLRRDGSSRFSESNRYGIFPAFSLGVRLTEFPFMQKLRFVNDLKVRGGWGRTGNQLIPNVYNAYTLYASDPNNNAYDINGTGSSIVGGFSLVQFGNRNGKWETTTSTNVGFDASLLNNQMDVVFDWYTRTTSDMLAQIAMPRTMGTATIPYTNIGEMRNTGFDLGINYKNKIGNFRYQVGASISHYKNEVIKLNDDPNATLFGFSTRLPPISATKRGLPIAGFYGYIVDGVIKDDAEAATAPKFGTYTRAGTFKFRDVNGDGVITAADRTILGNPHPDFTYGLNLNVGYKNWDLTVFGQGSQGNKIFNYVRYWTDFNTFQGNRSKDILYNSWKKQGDIAKLPRLNSGDATSQQVSSYFIEDGSYMRIKNIQLTYTIPSSWLKRVGLTSGQIYIQGQNLFTITKYTGLDPDINLRTSGNDNQDIHMGIDEGAYPVAKSYLVGVRIGF